jgi:hypothetical protein
MPKPPAGYRTATSSLMKPVTPPSKSDDAQPRFDYPLGAWEGGRFVFKSPAHEQQWNADSFMQGSHHLLWMKGEKLDPARSQLALMGLPHSDDIQLGPDGQLYKPAAASREDPHMMALRAAHLAAEPAQGSAFEMGRRASEKAMPKALQWMAQGGRVEPKVSAANDNWAAVNDNALKRPVAYLSETGPKATLTPAADAYPGIGRFAAMASVVHPVASPPHHSPEADNGSVHERSKNVATRSQVERFAPTYFEALGKEVAKYEADNPFFTRVGQRLKAGALDMDAASAANVGAAALVRLQRLAPYFDRIDRGENYGSVTTDPSDVAAHNSSDPNQPLPPQSPLTLDDIGLLADYYTATPEERLAQRKQMAGLSAQMLSDAATSHATSAAIARHPAVRAVARAIGEKRYRDAAEILKTYPLGIMGQIGVEGLPSALPGLAASLVNPALGAAVFAGSDATNAYGSALLSSLEAQGVDTTDPLAIQKALSAPDIREVAEKYASKWAMGSAAVGSVTGGVGGKVMSGAGKSIVEAAETEGVKTLAETGVELAQAIEKAAGKKGTGPAGQSQVNAKMARELEQKLFDAQRNFLTEGQARKLTGETRRIIMVTENRLPEGAARDFQEGGVGSFFEIESEMPMVPALEYKNPAPRGRNFIKLDLPEIAPDGTHIVLNDAKTRMATFNKGAARDTLNRLNRLRIASQQNEHSNVKAIWELPNEYLAQEAREFLRLNGHRNTVVVRVRRK